MDATEISVYVSKVLDMFTTPPVFPAVLFLYLLPFVHSDAANYTYAPPMSHALGQSQ